ncbi:MAG: hypothetical protein NTU89_02980, partial [Candidatus Dependentiae bacterium]|nr:hypothetical protein [Candidatus Dependentiae bacterium]
SFGGISSGFNSPEQALNARVPFKNEQGEEPCVRIKTPCSLVGDGKISPICRAANIAFLRRSNSSPSIKVCEQESCSLIKLVDDRQPEEGQVIKKLSAVERFKQSLVFWKSASWKDRLFDNVSKNSPEFECRDLGPNKIQMHIDCNVGIRSGIAHSINGEQNTKETLPDEGTERWFACATVEEISPGIYKTVVQTPNIPCFEQVRVASLKANKTYTYQSNRLPESMFPGSSPLHAHYGE